MSLNSAENQRTRLTRSSNNSASALNLLTNPERPKEPFLPRCTSGLNFESSALSRKTIRGYAMGTPVQIVHLSSRRLGRLNVPNCTTKCSTVRGSCLSRSNDFWYWVSLHIRSFLRSALHLRSMTTKAVEPISQLTCNPTLRYSVVVPGS